MAETKLFPDWTRANVSLIGALPLVLFTASIACGLVLSDSSQGDALLEALAAFIEPLVGLDPPVLIGLIFVNNALKTLIVILSGIALGIVPFLFLVINGLILGVVIAHSVAVHGFLYAMFALGPHGVVELPAALFSAGLGFRLAWAILQRIRGNNSDVHYWLRTGVRLYLRAILPALLLASLLEVLVTPALF